MADTRAMTVEEVRSALIGESGELLRRRRAFRRLPSPPRCKLCAAPFAGIGGLVLRHAGFARSPGNPALCTKCLGELRKRGMSGVEIPVTLLFSDVRGSTAMGERLRPTEFHAFLDHFYRLASEAIVAHDSLVDKIVGDEVVALFFGGISGPNHAAAAVAAAVDLAERAARTNASPSGPIPVGTAVHTGEAFVGGTGPGGTIVWVTTRRIKEGTLEELRQAWEPPEPPDGMTRAFEWVGADGRTIVGVSNWDSEDSCESYRSSAAEAERRERMAPYVESKESATYPGGSSRFPVAERFESDGRQYQMATG